MSCFDSSLVNVQRDHRISRRARDAPDRDAFHAESLALFESIYRIACRLTKSTAEAEDLTQETYVRALQASERFTWGTNLRAWLFTILRNVHRNQRRDQQRAIVVVDGDVVDRASGASVDTPETQLLRDAASRDLRAAIDALPAALAQTVWLRDIEELSYAEISARLGVPIGTVMSRLSRARELLYRQLAERRGATT